MNIYKVSRTDYHYHDDDDYEAFVCIAESDEDAKMLHPEDFHMELDERGFFKPAPTASWNGEIKRNLAMSKWASKPEGVSVKLIGVVSNDDYEIEQVILASKDC